MLHCTDLLSLVCLGKCDLLVRWVQEETLIPESASQSGHSYVGALGDIKWSGKYYEGDILGMSG